MYLEKIGVRTQFIKTLWSQIWNSPQLILMQRLHLLDWAIWYYFILTYNDKLKVKFYDDMVIGIYWFINFRIGHCGNWSCEAPSSSSVSMWGLLSIGHRLWAPWTSNQMAGDSSKAYGHGIQCISQSYPQRFYHNPSTSNHMPWSRWYCCPTRTKLQTKPEAWRVEFLYSC